MYAHPGLPGRFLLALLAVAVVAAPAVASRVGLVSFRRVAMPDDVPAHLCSALAVDPQGFLWLGSQGGLVRYDGYRFKTYRSDPSDPSTIGGSYVRALTVTRDGKIWVGLFSGGMSVLDPATERFTRYQHDPSDARSLAGDRVEGIVEGHDGSIWVATNAGLDRLDRKSGRFTHYRHDPKRATSLANDLVRGLLVTADGTLWVGTRAGLQRWQPSTEAFERVAPEVASELVTRLHADRRGRIWIGTSTRGAGVFDPATSAFHALPPQSERPDGLSHFWIYGFAEAGEKEMWVATFGGGIDVVDVDTLRVVDRLQHDATRDDAVPAARIGAIVRDHSGVVWVGTWGSGLAFHDPSVRAFRTLRFSPSNERGLTHPSVVRALEMRDGTIWAGTNGNGIDIFDQNLLRVAAHRADPNDPSALADGSITCLEQAPSGDIWVATLNGTLHRMQAGREGFRRYSVRDGLAGGPIRTIAFAADGTVWAGAQFGLTRIDPRSGAARAYRSGPATPPALIGFAIESIVVREDGKLWIGTERGLVLFDPSTGTATSIVRDPRRSDSLPDNWVPELMLDQKGRLWVGTHGGAALLRSLEGGRASFDVVSEKVRRPASPAEQLIEDGEGWVWIGATMRVHPDSWRLETFGPAEGNRFRTFFIASRARMRDGRLLFPSPEGLLVVDPSALRPWTYQPRIVATALRVGDEERAPVSRAVQLMPHSRAFRVEFAALDLTAPDRLRYRYILEGHESEWHEVDALQRSLTYGGLDPGSYVLRVGGSNRSGAWSSHELRMTVEVPPAFYETTLFRFVAAAAVALLLYGAYRWRVRHLRERGARLEQIIRDRTGELARKNEELGVAYAKIEEASLTDPLTGLRNRRYLEQTIVADVEMATRRRAGHAADADLIFLLVDLDHFKSVNDTHGHAAGDAVLQQIAEILRAAVRASDAVVRWGGEEFLVVARFLDRTRGPELGEKLRAAVEPHPFTLPGGGVLHRTCSIGIAPFPFAASGGDGARWEQVVDAADAALYAAKASGRNTWISVELREEADASAVLAALREHAAGALNHPGLLVRRRAAEDREA